MIDECGSVGGMRFGRGNRSTRREPALVPLCPPQVPNDLRWNADHRCEKSTTTNVRCAGSDGDTYGCVVGTNEGLVYSQKYCDWDDEKLVAFFQEFQRDGKESKAR
jgi:hypothetical protein